MCRTLCLTYGIEQLSLSTDLLIKSDSAAIACFAIDVRCRGPLSNLRRVKHGQGSLRSVSLRGTGAMEASRSIDRGTKKCMVKISADW